METNSKRKCANQFSWGHHFLKKDLMWQKNVFQFEGLSHSISIRPYSSLDTNRCTNNTIEKHVTFKMLVIAITSVQRFVRAGATLRLKSNWIQIAKNHNVNSGYFVNTNVSSFTFTHARRFECPHILKCIQTHGRRHSLSRYNETFFEWTVNFRHEYEFKIAFWSTHSSICARCRCT